MALLKPVYADSVMVSRKRKSCNGVPLPYLIRPRRILPPIDTFEYYNDYSLDDESNEGKSSMEAVETSTLDEDASSGHSDDEYVLVDNVEALPDSKTDKAGAIQMMELSNETVDDDGSESKDAGSNNDDWVVV